MEQPSIIQLRPDQTYIHYLDMQCRGPIDYSVNICTQLHLARLPRAVFPCQLRDPQHVAPARPAVTVCKSGLNDKFEHITLIHVIKSITSSIFSQFSLLIGFLDCLLSNSLFRSCTGWNNLLLRGQQSGIYIHQKKPLFIPPYLSFCNEQHYKFTIHGNPRFDLMLM